MEIRKVYDQPVAPFPAPMVRRQRTGNQSSAPSRVVSSGNATYFEALNNDKSRSPIPIAALQYKNLMMQRSRITLVHLARYIFDNYSLVGYAVGQIANYSVPVIPQTKVENPETSAAYEDYFKKWSRNAEFSGRFDFKTLQRLISIALDTDADTGALMTTENGFPQIQLIDSTRISHDESRNPNRGVKNFIDGVELDNKGRLQNYVVVEAEESGKVRYRKIPASMFLLLVEASRIQEYRGIPAMRRGLNDIRDAQDIKKFEKLGVKFSSSLAAVIENLDQVDPDVWGDSKGVEEGTALTGEEAYEGDETPQEKAIDWAEMLGGDIPVLPEGQKLNFIDTTRPHQNVQSFLDVLAGHFVASLEIPPAFFLDAKLTGPNQRSVIGKAQRRFDRRIETLKNFVNWTWVRVIGHGIDTGQLPADPKWDQITYQTPAKMTIDAGREMREEREDVDTGLMTRQEHFGARGLDWHDELQQTATEIKFIIDQAKTIAKETDIPVETILSRYGFEPKASAPAEAKGDNQKTRAEKDEEEEDEQKKANEDE